MKAQKVVEVVNSLTGCYRVDIEQGFARSTKEGFVELPYKPKLSTSKLIQGGLVQTAVWEYDDFSLVVYKRNADGSGTYTYERRGT